MRRLAAAAGLLGLLAAATPAAGQPCVAGEACLDRLPIGAGGGWARIHRTAPLDARDEAVTRGLVIVHGSGRDGDRAFALGVEAARAAGALETTLVVAPTFGSNDGFICDDAFEPGEIHWGCQGNNGWAAGGAADGDEALTTYDLVDEVLRRLADRERFPNLATIVVAGFSGGGQFVTRYEMANTVHEALGVPVEYVVGSPAMYAWPDADRPERRRADGTPIDPAAGCSIYDVWPYGLTERRGYAARLDAGALRAQLVARPVTYLLGERDTLQVALDTTCAGRAQGPTRVARGLAFVAWLRERYGATHEVFVVPGCGHDARCVFLSRDGLAALFPAR